MPSIVKAGNVIYSDDVVEIDAGAQFSPPRSQPEPLRQAATLNSTIPTQLPGRLPGRLSGRPSEQADMESKDDESAADLEKVREEAEYIIFSAKSEAQIIIENARQKMDEVRKNAAKEAYDKAYEKYAAEAQNTARAVTEKAEALMASAEREHDTATSEVEAQAVDLIIKIVDKLLRNSVKIKPDIILVLVREALRNTSENLSGLDVKLRVSPDDYNLVLQNMDELTYGEKTSDGRIELVMDDSLASMDCVIETPFGSVESSLQGQYESIKTDLTYLLHEGA